MGSLNRADVLLVLDELAVRGRVGEDPSVEIVSGVAVFHQGNLATLGNRPCRGLGWSREPDPESR